MTVWRWIRMAAIVGMAAKFFLQIFWYQWRRKSRQEWDGLMGRQAREFREKAVRLQGLLIKIGQFLSIRGDMLPKVFVEELSQLVDQVPSAGWEPARARLEQEWGKPYGEVLRTMDFEPVASASIGEVYKAELQDGTPVAVKVQRTGIDEVIQADFRAVRVITWLAKTFTSFADKVNFPMLYKELKAVIEREIDFMQEMETAIGFKKRFEHLSGVVVPDVYPEYSTEKVLVMEWIDAHKITDTEFLDRTHIDRKELAERLLRLFIPQWLEEGKFHADPHPGNVLVNADGDIILIDFGMIGEISRKDAGHLQQLVIALALKNYKKAVEQLVELEFVLPSANRTEIEVLLEEALSFDLQSFKKMNQLEMLRMKIELQELIKSLPVQVPTRFVFLGRAYAAVDGTIAAIHPEGDLLKLAEPVIKEWLKEQEGGMWKLFVSWLQDQPIYHLMQNLSSLLQEPRRFREWKEIEQRRQQEFSYLQGRKRDALVLTSLSAMFCYGAYWFQQPELFWVSSGLLVVTAGSYLIRAHQIKRFLYRK